MRIEDFDTLWQKSKADSETAAVFWDSRADAFNALHHSQENQARLDQLIAFWRAKEMLAPTAEVLDIGCGPGYISLALAPLVKQVDGIDLSPKMMAFAQKKQFEKGLKNILFRTLDWATADLEAIGWRKKFDFVFAVRCPGLNSRASLEKMIQASRKHCFISSFAKMESSLRAELNQVVKGCAAPFSPAGDSLYCAFNILWLMGYYPEISFYDTSWAQEYSLAEALATNTKYYEMRGGLSAAQNKALRLFLKEGAKGGSIKDQVNAKEAWLTWRV